MKPERNTLYIKGGRNTEVTAPDVFLGDILSMECADKMILAKLRAVKILKFPKDKKGRRVLSVLEVISRIHGEFPELDIRNLGETDMLITYENQKTPPRIRHLAKTAFAAAAVFFGAAFSIMAFNNDVDVTKLFGQIYELATGYESGGFTVLEVSYSIGVAAGILIFFNHFGKKRFTVDPTPMEVQMRLYENDIQTTLIENADRKGEEIDVDP